MTQAQTTPIGYGHVYAPQHYLDAWVALTAPEGWDETSLAQLRNRLSRRGGLADIQAGWFKRPPAHDFVDPAAENPL